MYAFFRKWLRLWRAHRWKCPYCGKKLVESEAHDSFLGWYCPDHHYVIIKESPDTIKIHDAAGDPIALLFTPRLTVVKGDTGKLPPKKET